MTPALAALALLAQASAPAPALDQLWRLQAGDEACDLFTRAERALLDGAVARARDDLVRTGADPARLDAARARQDGAGAPDCDDAALSDLAEDHHARVADLAAYTELSFPGVHREWRVDRRPVRTARAGEPRWRVSQRDHTGQAWFGVFEQDQEQGLAVAFNRQARPARAALAFRDPATAAHPVDFTAGGLLAAPDGDPAAGWGAPAGARTRATASGRLDADQAAHLAPAGGAPARGFMFPDAALRALADLTPRESAAVELYDRTGRVVERYWFEVGALRAALAMQAIPLPEPEPAPDTASAP